MCCVCRPWRAVRLGVLRGRVNYAAPSRSPVSVPVLQPASASFDQAVHMGERARAERSRVGASPARLTQTHSYANWHCYRCSKCQPNLLNSLTMKAGIRKRGGSGEKLSLCVTKRGRPIKQNTPSGHIGLSGQAITSQTQDFIVACILSVYSIWCHTR